MQLIEHYLSIQGEGLHSGKPTYFVRFAKCNLSCTWCDSTYTFGNGTEISKDLVLKSIQDSNAKYICLTGGEPLLHMEDCLNLIHHFPDLHFDIETGGSIDFAPVQIMNTSVIMDWKLVHSGMKEHMKKEFLTHLRPKQDLLKFVTDGSAQEKTEIEKIIQSTSKIGFPISIQPVYGTDSQKLTEWMLSLKNPRLQLNLQIHKVIWGPDRAGV